MGVVNAAVFGGGILAVGTERSSRYAYREATPDLINAIREVEHLCREHGVSLAAAALQFSLRDARIASTVVGVSRPKRIEETLPLAATPHTGGPVGGGGPGRQCVAVQHRTPVAARAWIRRYGHGRCSLPQRSLFLVGAAV